MIMVGYFWWHESVHKYLLSSVENTIIYKSNVYPDKYDIILNYQNGNDKNVFINGFYCLFKVITFNKIILKTWKWFPLTPWKSTTSYFFGKEKRRNIHFKFELSLLASTSRFTALKPFKCHIISIQWTLRVKQPIWWVILG